jgi:4-diphosphocytidyl-2-C-methyl-D-erythritol kinase
MIEEAAPAKVNLALHVTGQRADGYHLLDSLVVFTRAGDRLTFAPADEDRLTISGRFGASLPKEAGGKGGNLVLSARDALRAHAKDQGVAAPAVHIHLDKNLPIASGIGGGSADAAATLRGLNRLWKLGLDSATLRAIGLPIGADVPMCVESRPLLARGIGEEIETIADFPELDLLLVNPLAEVATPAIFRALAKKDNPSLRVPAGRAAFDDWIGALARGRNDLEAPATTIEPKVLEALSLLDETAPLIARMSGSGATCFGLYRSGADCRAAAERLEALRPEWYLSATTTRGLA